jgi:hypothetical protein
MLDKPASGNSLLKWDTVSNSFFITNNKALKFQGFIIYSALLAVIDTLKVVPNSILPFDGG